MGLWDKLFGEFIDVIEWIDDDGDTMVYRFERYGNEIKYGAKLIVRESQTAVFVNEGEIAIDGVNIKSVTKHSLRSLMGIVTQESVLFNDTVMGNLLLGVDDKTEEDVIAAAKVANAHEFIVKLPDGYNTNIGDSGNKLSGGQKQRLSIARAVLSNPDILILDEATSALDTESEKLVQEALEHLMQNRTSIVIAHRLSTIQNADIIVVMKEGKIVEVGKHNELMSKEGAYNKLIKLQSFE
jgi:subfamily B ATP-binding cassette protein MsbA